MPALPAISVELQSTSPDDRPFLEGLFREVHAPEFAALGLPAPMLDQLLAMQFEAQAVGYGSQFPHAEDQLILLDGEPAGRLLVARTGDAIQVIDIALLGRWRGRGVGTHLLTHLAGEAQATGRPLRLTVRFNNPALRLYERLGFTRTGSDGLNLSLEYGGEPDSVHHSQPRLDQPTGTSAFSAAFQDQTGDDDETAPVPKGSSSRYFRSLLGQPICANSPGGVAVELTLNEVEPLRHGMDGSDSFVLRFTGPLTPVLSSAMVDLIPRAQDAVVPVFLVPHGPGGGLMQYEAIFNRL